VSRSRKILSIVALVGAGTLIGAGSASATSCPNTSVEVTGLSQSQMESSIGCLINEERTSRGLGAVQPNADLRRAAVSHSTEMVDQGYFEHTSPAGLTFIGRIENFGYMRGARAWMVGENLVWGSGPRSTPDSLVTAWMNSAPHRENLLRGRFDEIGIAAVLGTPESRSDATGVTVSSEYGYRAGDKKRHAGKAKKAKRRHAKSKRRHAKSKRRHAKSKKHRHKRS
jgi:uncharacterized protein YkwD